MKLGVLLDDQSESVEVGAVPGGCARARPWNLQRVARRRPNSHKDSGCVGMARRDPWAGVSMASTVAIR